jgi:hypothetical protein
MTDKIGSAEYQKAIDYAAARGARDGENASDSQYWPGGGRDAANPAQIRQWARTTLAAMDEGNFDWYSDMLPSADLSGEWADTLTGPELVSDAVWRAYGGLWDDRPELEQSCADWFSDICDAYETAFDQAATDYLARWCHDLLTD